MPVIAQTRISSTGAVTATETTLNGTDSLVYVRGKTKYLFLRNPTGSAITPVIDGADATSEYVPGLGVIATSGGFSVGSIAAGASRVVDLDSIFSYLKGTVEIKTGSGLVAILAVV